MNHMISDSVFISLTIVRNQDKWNVMITIQYNDMVRKEKQWNGRNWEDEWRE